MAFPAKGEAVATSFDISIPTRNAWVSVRGTQPGTNDRNNNAAGRIFTIGAEGSAVIKFIVVQMLLMKLQVQILLMNGITLTQL